MTAQEELLKAITDSPALIGYSPIGDEPDVGDFLTAHKFLKHGISVLPTPDVNPNETARALISAHEGKKVCLFVPGRVFDSSGTRHGRGGGWYDRFLSKVPHEWVRVGVLHTSHMSDTPLVRQAWDEPVDFLIIKDGGWRVLKTGARTAK